MEKYIIQYANNIAKDVIETKQNYINRKDDQRLDGETDDELVERLLNSFWSPINKFSEQGDWAEFYNDQTNLKLLWDKRLAKGKDYIQSSPTKASLIDTLTSLEKEVHMIWHSKAVEVQLMKKTIANNTGNNTIYEKNITDLNTEITTLINPVGEKLTKIIMDINNKTFMGSFDETRMEFTLTLMTSTETFGGTTPSDIIDEIATRTIELFEKLKEDLHENDNDYRPANYIKWLKTNMLDDPSENEDEETK